ncbi:MAG: TAXI family TRAP transporter solute-binding subunit [Hyphomicrobiaceae bacterium]
MRFAKWSAAAALAMASIPSGAIAADVKLPSSISWTAYGTTSSGYAQSVGIGQMLKSKYNVDLRIIPGKNDVSRMSPLKAGQTDLCACGIAVYYAQEGVEMFATRAWGPQRIRNLFNNIGRNGAMVAVAADVGIKTMVDLKGKRVVWVKGAPALNNNMAAGLAFAGLTWNDVQKVEVPGFKQSLDAIINGQADAAFASTITTSLAQLAASPRGLYYVPEPHNDAAGWKRAHAIAPYWVKGVVTAYTNGARNAGPFDGARYPYPTFISTEKTTDEFAYSLTKAVMDNYEDIKESGPGMDGYQLKQQNFQFVFPYHPGSITYFKEKGVWTAADDTHNAATLKRQDVLAAAWKEMLKKSVSDDKFKDEWMKVRAAALGKAGMPVIFH